MRVLELRRSVVQLLKVFSICFVADTTRWYAFYCWQEVWWPCFCPFFESSYRTHRCVYVNNRLTLRQQRKLRKLIDHLANSFASNEITDKAVQLLKNQWLNEERLKMREWWIRFREALCLSSWLMLTLMLLIQVTSEGFMTLITSDPCMSLSLLSQSKDIHLLCELTIFWGSYSILYCSPNHLIILYSGIRLGSCLLLVPNKDCIVRALRGILDKFLSLVCSLIYSVQSATGHAPTRVWSYINTSIDSGLSNTCS